MASAQSHDLSATAKSKTLFFCPAPCLQSTSGRRNSTMFDVVQRLWTDTENFSFEGKSPWKVRNGYITPKPQFGRPVLVNATGSEAGIAFAAKYSDIVFITSPGGAHIDSALETLPPHIANIKDAAA